MANTILTREGYEKLVAELDFLRNVKRAEVSERLRSAIEGGGDDLLENAEYEAAKNEQSFTEGRIKELEYLVAVARVVDSSESSEIIEVGSKIEISEEGSDIVESYIIVGAPEANPEENKISNESPIGKAVIGHKKGDIVQVSAPIGSYNIKIINIH
ncbi:transcription elongation factor GreA [Flexilinea flocculi]|uniref:Transcription elongation factor GreA n=2 Tax=Flexilinea flocculi TaxID=1678840 RepID=A0A0K8PBF1_9CHLR|nr:transcription elongation factor GreA [Flexilinea flocculi]